MPDSHLASGGSSRRHRTRQIRWARSIAVAAVVLTLTIAFHSVLPGSLGTLTATVLPWLGWLLPVLTIGAFATRRHRAWIITLAPALAWALLVAPAALPLGDAGGSGSDSLTVATHNVRGGEGTAIESARALARENADLISLVELTDSDREGAAAELAEGYPYSYQVGTVGLWSKYPLAHEQPLDLGLGWKRALSADVLAPGGTVSVYVVHAASFRPGSQAERDTMLRNLGELVPQDVSERLIVMGDFNATAFDPALGPLLETVSEPRTSGLSWGFTWPTSIPIARIDHIFERGLTAVESRVITAGASDHKAIVTRFDPDHTSDDPTPQGDLPQ